MRGPWSKWGRAETHLKALRVEAGGHVSGFHPDWFHRYPVTVEAHREGREYRFYVEARPFDAEGCALIVGDFLFNLRSALDHIVYELHAKRFRGRPIPEKRTAFPILDRRPTGRQPSGKAGGRSADPAKWREIRLLSEKQRRAIVFLQPYNRRNDKYREVRRALAEINALNNIDKHRHLHVVETGTIMAPVGRYAELRLPGAYGFRQQSFLMEPLVGKTEVFRWTFDTVPPDIANEIQKQRDITAAVFLDEGGEKTLLIPLLASHSKAVAAVLDRFEVFLPY
jgi:hypothetical protein